MSVKRIRWHAAALAFTVVTVLAVLFSLATVTSNADDIIKVEDAENKTVTYKMTNCTYDNQIVLDQEKTTIVEISGDNKLTYGSLYNPGSNYGGAPQNPCIGRYGNLVITGNGTLDASGSCIRCTDITIEKGAKLKVGSYGLFASGIGKVDNAEIESQGGYLSCGKSGQSEKNVFNNATLKLQLQLGGDTAMTDCDVTLNNAKLYSVAGELTIDGGSYNIYQYESDPYSKTYLDVEGKAIIKNAFIKTNALSDIRYLDMTDTIFECNIPDRPGTLDPALTGENLSFSGCKINVSENILGGINATGNLTIKNNTEMNVTGKYYGLVGKSINITNSSGILQATDPEATAAIAAYIMQYSQDTASAIPGTITLEDVDLKELTDVTIDQVTASVYYVPNYRDIQSSKQEITTILDGDAPVKSVAVKANHTTHIWDAGEVTKQPTATEDGVKTYTCTICGATKTEVIPKLASQESQADSKGEDGTVFSKGASTEAAEAAILALPNDNDPAGTAFGLLQLKATKVTKNSIKLNWKAVPGAAKYIIFANKCGTGNKYKKLIEVTGTSLNVTQAAGAALKRGTYYKFMMIAADANGKVVSTSKTVHAATKGGKVGNHKKVTVKKSVTKKAKKLKKGKTLKLKAKAVPQAKKLKVRKHRGIKYESSNPKVAQVSGKGSVKGVGKGTCYIYAYAQNGTCAKVKVTVK